MLQAAVSTTMETTIVTVECGKVADHSILCEIFCLFSERTEVRGLTSNRHRDFSFPLVLLKGPVNPRGLVSRLLNHFHESVLRSLRRIQSGICSVTGVDSSSRLPRCEDDD